MSNTHPIENWLREDRSLTGVREQEFKKEHEVYDRAPCDWSEAQGATHTLYCGEGCGKGTRPAKLLKTVLYVGTDEQDDKIVWEKWSIKTLYRWENPRLK